MSRVSRINRLAVAAVLALALSWTAACNSVSNQSNRGEAVVVVTGTAVNDGSVASTVDTTASLTFTVFDRDTNRPTSGAANFFTDVTFTGYQVTYSPTALVPDIANGVISTSYFSVGSSGILVLTMVPNGSKPAAGTVVVGDVHLNGRPVSFETSVAIAFTP